MAKLVIGTNKQTVVPAVVRDMSPAHYIEKTVDANGKLVNVSNFIDLTGVTDIGDYALYSAYNHSSITSMNMGSVTTISGNAAMQYCFQNSSLTSVNLSPVENIIGGPLSYCFDSCASLETANLDTVKRCDGLSATFRFCSGLKSVSLNGLNIITGQLATNSSWGVFNNCSKLEDVYFGGLTASTFANAQNQLQYLFNSNTGQNAPNGCTVHFPSNFDPSDPNHTFDASTLTGYPTFNGNASYIHVAFDLPETE